MYPKFFKRIFDFTVSLSGIIFLLPVFLFISVIILVQIGNPFFVQLRPGKNGKIFKLIKFKTMTDIRDENGNLLNDSRRITKTGRILRLFSLDELPQLINVIKGDMSLVGPRPLLIKYLPLYTERQSRRHSVRPGITGLAQINGRNIIEWKDRFEMDVHYTENIGFILDLKILYNTFLKVLRREGINTSDETTMTPFTGNNK